MLIPAMHALVPRRGSQGHAINMRDRAGQIQYYVTRTMDTLDLVTIPLPCRGRARLPCCRWRQALGGALVLGSNRSHSSLQRVRTSTMLLQTSSSCRWSSSLSLLFCYCIFFSPQSSKEASLNCNKAITMRSWQVARGLVQGSALRILEWHSKNHSNRFMELRSLGIHLWCHFPCFPGLMPPQ